MKNKEKKIVIIIIIIVIILAILNIYKCPIKHIFGLSCPLCGMTRAFLSLLRLDISKAFYYHLLWPVALLLLIFYILIERKIIRINKRTIYIVLYIICAINLIYYFYRLFNNSNIVYFRFEKSLIKRIIDLVF